MTSEGESVTVIVTVPGGAGGGVMVMVGRAEPLGVTVIVMVAPTLTVA